MCAAMAHTTGVNIVKYDVIRYEIVLLPMIKSISVGQVSCQLDNG
jgi:hypothetical protein